MEFDLKETFSSMLIAAKSSASGHWKHSKEIINQFFEINEKHFELIVRQYLEGKIDNDKFEYRLNELKENFELQMLTVKIATKVAAQNAINAAIEVFQKAVKTAIKL